MSQQIKDPASTGVQIRLPRRLVDFVNDLGLTSQNNKHLNSLIAICWHRYLTFSQTETEFYSEMSVVYISKVTSHRFYKEVFLQFTQNISSSSNSENNKTSLFETTGSYDVEKGKAKRYRIKPDLIHGELVPVNVDIELEDYTLNSVFPDIIRHFDNSFGALSIDEKDVNAVLQDIIHPIGVHRDGIFFMAKTVSEANDLSSNKSKIIRCDKVVMPSGTIHYKGAGLPLLKKLFEEVKISHPSAELVIDGKTAFIGNYSDYYEKKHESMVKKAKYALASVSAGEVYRGISSVNGRLHSTISNMHGTLLPFFKLEEETLASIDLRSSQPCILANLLKGEGQLIESLRSSKYPQMSVWSQFVEERTNPELWSPFLDFLIREDLYGWVAEQSGNTRSWAKHEFMVLLFSAPGFNSPIAPYLDSRFPDFNRNLRALKKDCSKLLGVPLAVLLQRVEAHIFIEKILSRIAEMDIPAFSRHDSIIYASTSERHVQMKAVIDQVFNELNFTGEMKESTHFVLSVNDESLNCPSMNDYFISHRYLENGPDAKSELEAFLTSMIWQREFEGETDWDQFKNTQNNTS